MLAEFLGIGCVTVVQEIRYEPGKVICRRDVGGGSAEWIEARLPVLVACQIGLNQPRYATALNIIKAKKKEVKTLTLAQLGLSGQESKTRLKDFELPAPKAPCRFIPGNHDEQARELVRILREEISAI
jgi:electron transfer flavoprotein beta subunit